LHYSYARGCGRFLEQPPKQLLISVQKYIIAVQHGNKTFECKKEE
jgi:hypothetical protein